jgi:hypothetical protein
MVAVMMKFRILPHRQDLKDVRMQTSKNMWLLVFQPKQRLFELLTLV